MARFEQFVVRLRCQLAHRWMPVWGALLGVFLCLPSVGLGLQTEDYVHRAKMEDGAAPWALYSYVGGGASAVHHAKARGDFPWLATEELRAAFFRPLSSLSLALDHAAWPGAPWLGHVQNLLWYGLLVLLVGCLYRRLTEPLWLSGIATLFYAVDDAHGLAVGWLANRNALMATAFGVGAVIAHVSFRRERRLLARALSPFLLALALLSGELALGAVGYLVAFAICLDDSSWARRCLSLLPAAAVTAAWAIFYKWAGYGTAATLLHVDPWAHPWMALEVAWVRAPALLVGALALPPSDFWNLLGRGEQQAAALIALGFLALVLWLLFPLLRRRADARFWALGAAFSLLPIATTFPQDRLLFFVGIGLFGLVAALWRDVQGELGNRAEEAPVWRGFFSQRFAAALLVLLVAVHGVVAPVLLPLRSLTMADLGGRIEAAQASLFPESASASGFTMVVNSPSFFVPSLAATLTLAQRRPYQPLRVLYGGEGPATVERVSAHSLRITASEGFGTHVFDGQYVTPAFPFRPGAGAQYPGLVARVEKVTDDGRPREVVFTVPGDMSRPQIRWMQWKEGAYVPFELPAVGETVTVPPSAQLR